MYGGGEGGGVFGVSCGDAASSFQVRESVFDEVATFVEFFIIRPLNETVFLEGHDRLHVLVLRLINEGIAIVATIRPQIVRAQSFDQAASRCAIRRGAWCKSLFTQSEDLSHTRRYI